jgi:hypothetical protein
LAFHHARSLSLASFNGNAHGWGSDFQTIRDGCYRRAQFPFYPIAQERAAFNDNSFFGSPDQCLGFDGEQINHDGRHLFEADALGCQAISVIWGFLGIGQNRFHEIAIAQNALIAFLENAFPPPVSAGWLPKPMPSMTNSR